MKKVFNPRPILYVAAAQIVGIIFADYFGLFGAWSFIIPAAIVTVIAAVVFITVKRHRILTAVTFVCCITFSLTGALALKYKVDKVATESEKFENGNYVIVGVVEYASYSHGVYSVRLSDCSLNGERSGNVAIYGLKSGISVCDEIRVEGFVGRTQKYSGYKFSSYVINGSSFVCYNGGNAEIIGWECRDYRI